jgi:hypothetical protein
MQSSTTNKPKPERVQTPNLTNEERRIIKAYCKKYRQKKGAALLLAAIPAMKADLGLGQLPLNRNDAAPIQRAEENVSGRLAA